MMKLKVLPPTLRKNNRYLALDIKVKSVISKDDLVNIVWNGCIRFLVKMEQAILVYGL